MKITRCLLPFANWRLNCSCPIYRASLAFLSRLINEATTVFAHLLVNGYRSFIAAAALFALLISPAVADPKEKIHEERLEHLRQDLDKAQSIWEESIDDPVSDAVLQRSYQALQDKCHELAKRKGGFATAREQQLCEIARYPYEIYYNEMIVKVNNLRKQLFEIETAGTVANDYYRRPSKSNLDKLRNIFEQVNKYYVGAPYTWNRYYNKFLFARSRLSHARKIWEDRLRDYKVAAKEPRESNALDIARKRAEFAFQQLKKETQKNNLPFSGLVGAFSLSRDLNDYLQKEKEWVQCDLERKQAGRTKEVVIFIHGLGEDRDFWKKFPVLTVQEDLVVPDMDRYFRVYVFRFDTVEDSKSVEGFRRELAGFIKDIFKTEEVSHVNLVGHSLGGVVSLKYLVQYLDEELQEHKLPKDAGEMAKMLLDGYLDGRYKRPIARFIGIAPSLSGSEVANFMAGLFKKDPPMFERSLAPFQSGIPIAGDLQVLENQIGSRVNLDSFTRLDFERSLDPYTLLDFLCEKDRANISAEQMEKLHQMRVKTLTIIGKQPFTVPPFGGPEEDGLVKCYSANLNHIYMAEFNAKSDIGYKSADVRYVRMGHAQLMEVGDRNHPSYEYVISFLRDQLIPQKDTQAQDVKHFICLLRVYPGDYDLDDNPDFCFYPEEKVYFSKDQRYELPALKIQVRTDKGATSNATIQKSSWNPFTGVYFVEGTQSDKDEPAWITAELSAPGFETSVIHVPVSGGLVTYCVRLKLKRS